MKPNKTVPWNQFLHSGEVFLHETEIWLTPCAVLTPLQIVGCIEYVFQAGLLSLCVPRSFHVWTRTRKGHTRTTQSLYLFHATHTHAKAHMLITPKPTNSLTHINHSLNRLHTLAQSHTLTHNYTCTHAHTQTRSFLCLSLSLSLSVCVCVCVFVCLLGTLID